LSEKEVPNRKKAFEGGNYKMTTYSPRRKKGFRWLFALVTVTTLAVPYAALSAGPAFRNSGNFSVSSSHLQQFFSHPFHRSRFFGGDEFDGLEVTLEQSQPVPTIEPEKPAKNRTYVQPHWVDGGFGVEVLEPGYWTDTEKEPGR
jgi:hypothetical protein